MMKVSVVSPNRLRAPDPLIPVGAAVVAGHVRELGNEVRFLDLCHEPDAEAAIRDHFRGWSPDLVAVSVRNLENNQLFGHRSFLEDVRTVISCIRAVSAAPVIAGGAGFSLFPRQALSATGADAGFAGEVEDSLEPLLPWAVRVLRDSRHLSPDGGRAPAPTGAFLPGNQAEPRCETSMRWADGQAPLPAYDLLDCPRYAADGAVIPVEGKRGCALYCSFCPDGIGDVGARLKAPDVLADQIERLVELVGTNRLFFTDGIFQLPRAHAEGVCRELIGRRIGVRWSCGINPAGLDRDLLELMREAGCRVVALGIDGVTPEMLRSYRKGFARGDIERAISDTRAAGLRHTIHVLFGGPGETDDSIARALDELERLVPDDDVFLAVGLRVFKGTDLEATAIAERMAGPAGALLVPEPTYYLSPAVRPDVVDLLQSRCREHRGWYAAPF